MSDRLTVVILTYNEEIHIARCIESIRSIADEVIVIDSFSNDRTVECAKRCGAAVHQHPFINQAAQFNWALDSVSMIGDWCLRLDADEYMTEAAVKSVRSVIDGSGDPSVTGFYLNRRMHFCGKPIRWGGCYPVQTLRLFRRGAARCEQRWMDEHLVLTQGRACPLAGDLVDDNQKNIDWWIAKHNAYATREAVELLLLARGSFRGEKRLSVRLRSREGRKRFVKEKLYVRIPGGVRAGLYFTYRYFLRLGFLDGAVGFTFHFFQAWWYRALVDAKLAEIKRRADESGDSIEDVVAREYGLRIE